jgi:hypothetical protein
MQLSLNSLLHLLRSFSVKYQPKHSRLQAIIITLIEQFDLLAIEDGEKKQSVKVRKKLHRTRMSDRKSSITPSSLKRDVTSNV